jgi:hypothetical protein
MHARIIHAACHRQRRQAYERPASIRPQIMFQACARSIPGANFVNHALTLLADNPSECEHIHGFLIRRCLCAQSAVVLEYVFLVVPHRLPLSYLCQAA